MDKQSRLWMSYERIMQVKTRLYVYCESRQILTDTMKSKKKSLLKGNHILALPDGVSTYQQDFNTASKLSIFGVFLVRILLHLD